MSQYPPPYDPRANFAYDPSMRDPLGPARKASILMTVMSILMLLYGLCNGAGSLLTSNDDLIRQMQSFNSGPMPMGVGVIRAVAVILSAAILVAGLLMLLNAGGVSRGQSGSITVTLIVVGSVVALLGLLMLMGLLGMLAVPAMGILSCALSIPLVLFVLLMVWLLQARRGSDRMRSIQMQYQQQQYAMYQHAMQQYGQPQAAQPGYGYGYSYPPPPAPPASSDKPPENPDPGNPKV